MTTTTKPKKKSAKPAKKTKPEKSARLPKKETASAGETQAVQVYHDVPVIGDSTKVTQKGLSAQLDIDAISTKAKLNPRLPSADDDANHTALVQSIREHGLLQPLSVRPSKKSGEFDLIAGRRRLDALKQLKHSTVPVLIRLDLSDDDEATCAAIAENQSRIGLDPVAVGRTVLALQDRGWKLDDIVTAMKGAVDKSTVSRWSALPTLPDDVQAGITKGDIPVAVGSELALIEDKKARVATAKQVTDSLRENHPMTINDVKKIRAKLSAEAEADDAAEGGDTEAPNAKQKKKSKRMVVKKTPAEVNEKLAELCANLCDIADRDSDDAEKLELRALVCALLWWRGDLEEITPVDPEEKKADAAFMTLVTNEAERLEPVA